MASYLEIRNRTLLALGKAYVQGKGHFIHHDWSTNDPDNETEKRVLAELKAEGSIEQDAGASAARFTAAGYNKHKDQIAAAATLG